MLFAGGWRPLNVPLQRIKAARSTEPSKWDVYREHAENARPKSALSLAACPHLRFHPTAALCLGSSKQQHPAPRIAPR
jgi:hypothetical protein